MDKFYIEGQLNKTLKKLKDIEFALNESSIVAITDSRGIINHVNDKFCTISKYSREELIGKDHRIINSGYHSPEFFRELWSTIKNGEIWKGEIKNKANDGTYYWVDTTIVPFLDDKSRPYQYVSIRNDITDRKNIEQDIKQMAYYDPLTNLPNRYLLNRRLKEVLLNKNDKHQTAILFLDLDRFKSINDTLGHTIGDSLLKEVGQRLKSCLRETDFISRQGGDEFIIFLDFINCKQEVIKVANRILDKLSPPFFIGNEKILISASIGISLHLIEDKQKINKETVNDSIETLIKQADIAMYYAKEIGGNNYQFNTPVLNEKIVRNLNLEKQLKQALEKDEFSIVYQPLVNLTNGGILRVEALIRWENSQFGMISPMEFIPILEETGLIVPVGRWILKGACNQMKKWRDDGIQLSRIAVNVSPIQFKHHQFIKDIKQILKDTQLEPELLELEITESVIWDIKESMKILKELKSLDVKISIDDFGTGYSSLSYLKHLPIDNLKIDKSFINDLDKDGEVIVKTIIDMGRNLKFNVIAEGIETEKQLSFLKNQGCHIGQGYFFSKPISPQEISELLLN
ncbi:putative bifunctional diguanylate cyclase/phosphodiesterase [Bacillus songklensis]|uniref:Bifunctional diguanylate cyclase/phosphodiesterase n=1 Tax=Bacillus songklensis TaxID=1069116 RepID=A0ABV8B2P4_9BACI